MSAFSLKIGDEEASFGDLLILLAYGIPLMIWKGYALSVLWAWFIMPFGAPAISIAAAIGCVIVVHMFIPTSKRKVGRIDHGRVIASAIGDPLFALGFGWIVLQFMN